MDNTNQFYQPGNSYGGTPGWDQTQFVTDFLDPQIPQGVYGSYLAGQGLGGFDSRSRFAQSQYGRTQQGYQSALRQNPALSYFDYLNQQFGTNGMQNMWAGLAPQQRGESSYPWTGPERFIGWG